MGKLVRENINDYLPSKSEEEIEEKIKDSFIDELLYSGINSDSPRLIKAAAEKFYKYQDEQDIEDVELILLQNFYSLIDLNKIEIVQTIVETGLISTLSDDTLIRFKDEARTQGKKKLAEIIDQAL